LRDRFIYANKKVVVKGLGTMKPSSQLECLNNWFDYLTEVSEGD
jgi:transcription-repair coupling factor (superfamily II helicase)